MRFTLGKFNAISLRTGLALTAAAGLAASGLAMASSAGAETASHGIKTAHSCAASKKAGTMACQAVKVTSGVSALAKSAGAVNPKAAPSGYGPDDLRSAYGLPSDGGSGATVAIVDAYDDPNAEQDLATYRSTYGLPACTTANGCFSKVDQSGTTSLPTADAGWAEEISLDLDMVSAVCPQCHILLVEANSSSMDDLGAAVNTAVTPRRQVRLQQLRRRRVLRRQPVRQPVLQPPGRGHHGQRGRRGLRRGVPGRLAVRHRGRRHLADQGLQQPRLDRVGLVRHAARAARPMTPSRAGRRTAAAPTATVADVSAVADPATGVAVYDTYGGDGGWEVFGGTSASSPIIASVYALAGTPSSGSYPASFPYAHTSSLNDVTSGSNGSCGTAYLCTGGAGYDGPTGLGTPNGVAAFAG